MGVEFWTPMIDFFRERLLAGATISPGDLALVTLTDSPDEAAARIASCRVTHAEQIARHPRPAAALGEKRLPGPPRPVQS
jgi:hypothetical protein